uniref:Putative esterase C44C1.5 n=2 Tax=Aceria tosichella TaxID=561515 RepID=A0A6G1SRC8_9ACAR
MELAGDQAAPSRDQIAGFRIGGETSATITSTTTTTIKTFGHDRMQALGGLLGRHQRSLAQTLPEASQRTDLPGTSSQPSVYHQFDDQQQQQNSAIAERLLGGPAPTTSSTSSSSIHQETTTTTTMTQGEMTDGSMRHLLEKYVNLELVRDLIVRHSIELAISLVILIYLVYYFSRISRRPKLIGNKSSDFVAAIDKSFKQTLQSRFSPLIYFWGTNPQTALFGYLQGQTSNDEMPRSKFHRQYLYVSDAQYLASNIDLSEHYEKCAKRTRRHRHRLCQHQQILEEEEQELTGQLDSSDCTTRHLSENIRFVLGGGGQLETVGADVKVGAAGVMTLGKAERGPLARNHKYHSEGEEEEDLELADRVGNTNESGGSENGTQRGAAKMNRMLTRTTSADCSEASPIGSSSDSGVFASSGSSSSSSSSSNSSSASSSSSGSSLTIDMVSTPRSGQSKSSRSPSTMSSSSSSSSSSDSTTTKAHSGINSNNNNHDDNNNSTVTCSCSSLYENKFEELAMMQDQQRNGPIPSLSHKHQHNHVLAGDVAHKATSPTAAVAVDQQQQNHSQPFKREHFEFGQCALDWYLDSHEHYHNNKSVALISAGMTTGSDKKYVTDTVQTLHRLGYEVCVFIRRGVGGLKLNSTKFFSPSKWHDFETAIVSIKKQRPNCRLVAIGFSFGSIELCRYLSMSGQRSLVDSALLISCPFDPEAGGRNMRKRALNRKIDAYLAKNLGKQLYQALSVDDSTSDSSSDNERTTIESMEEGDSGLQTDSSSGECSTTSSTKSRSSSAGSGKHHRASSVGGRMTTAAKGPAPISNRKQFVHENYNGSLVDLSSLPKIKSLVDFEDNYNRVIQHYPNSDAYGADSRLNDQLAQIRTPTLCLSSEDDFMAPFKLLPIKQIEANDNLCMILTKRGGHMAFIDGLLWPRKPYFAQRIIEEYMKLTPKVNDNNNKNNNN